jgi:predicted nucleotidyltransferase
MNLKITQLSKLSIALYRKYKDEIKDIILFGSILRGKIEPTDIDILMVFNKKINKDIEYEFKKSTDKYFNNISIISKTDAGIYDESFSAREAILSEGYSLIKGQFISEKNGFSSYGLFIYQTKSLNNADKTMFYYSLNGRRGSKGVIESFDSIKISDNVLAVPLVNVEKAKDFFNQWNLEFTYIPSLIPSRLAKKHIIGKTLY